MTQLHFDLTASRAARDDGLQRVGSHSRRFTEDALRIITRLPAGSVVTGEDIRRLVMQAGIIAHHPNAWGALIRVAVARALLAPTGEHRPMTEIKSHARQTPVYRRRG